MRGKSERAAAKCCCLEDQRGSILVMSGVIIPVMLLLMALIVDVGNWYTHKRQLQNRADAGALAAGGEYARRWKACVQSSDLTLKATTARAIANAARQYAADPEISDYSPDPAPASLFNSEIATQAQVDVVINSSDPNYIDDTDYSDGPGYTGNPCYLHPADDISAAGYWTDVKVKERDLPSLFGGFGLPLSRNMARARVDIRPQVAGNRVLPLAIPNNIISKVQVRYYDECRDPSHTSPLATRDLARLPSADQVTYASAGGGSLWGLPVPGDPTVGDRNLSFGLTVPSYGGCGQDYLPIGVEVRIASRDEVDLNASCAALASSKFADCFGRLSQLRVYNDGNADSQARLTNVRAFGGCLGPADGYFGRLPNGSTDCRYGVSAEVDWGTRDNSPLNVAGNFTVSANGTPLTLSSWNVPNGTAIYASSPIAFVGNPGANNVTISVAWSDTDTSHSWAGNQCKSGNGNPCKYSATESAHRVFVGNDTVSGAVALVRTSQSGFAGGLPGPPMENVATGGGSGTPASPITIYPTVGITSVLKTGSLEVLRTEDPQGSRLVQCDPAVANGQEISLFRNGCEPWFAANQFTSGPWWNTATKDCPDSGLWYGAGTMPAPYGLNGGANPWRCIIQAPGSSTGQTGDWMAAATDNCDSYNSNSCQSIKSPASANCANYDGKPGQPNGWLQQGGNSADPRVIKLFIIPYQALKNVSGSKAEIPVLGFASFYVMNWTGQNSSEDDPCPDPDFGGITVTTPGKGTVTGVFVETVEFETGPVDPNGICTEGDLTPCRITLVR